MQSWDRKVYVLCNCFCPGLIELLPWTKQWLSPWDLQPLRCAQHRAGHIRPRRCYWASVSPPALWILLNEATNRTHLLPCLFGPEGRAAMGNGTNTPVSLYTKQRGYNPQDHFLLSCFSVKKLVKPTLITATAFSFCWNQERCIFYRLPII